MSALPCLIGCASDLVTREVTKPTNVDGIIVEAWAEGYMVGSLIIMSCITVANMRRGVLLHKLILTEVRPRDGVLAWSACTNPSLAS